MGFNSVFKGLIFLWRISDLNTEVRKNIKERKLNNKFILFGSLKLNDK